MKRIRHTYISQYTSAAIKRGIGYAAFPLIVISASSIGTAVAHSSKTSVDIQTDVPSVSTHITSTSPEVEESSDSTDSSMNVSADTSNTNDQMSVEINGQSIAMPESGTSEQTVQTDSGPVNVQMSQSGSGEASSISTSSSNIRINSSSSTRVNNTTERSNTSIRIHATD